jgi:uncharacterized integral membrane protein
MMVWWEWQVPLPYVLFGAYIVGVLAYSMGFAHGTGVPTEDELW